MRRLNGWSDEVIAVRLEGLTPASDARPEALFRRFDPDCCLRATWVLRP